MERDSAMKRFEALKAVIFDLDGVVTRTAALHAAAWKRLFDDYFTRRAEDAGDVFVPFDVEADYRQFVDGKPRHEGVRSFLASRGIDLPDGDPGDPADRETVRGLGNRKNLLFQKLLVDGGVEVFEGTVALIHALKDKGIRTALVSSSRNAQAVLDAANLADLFEVRVDGEEAAHLGLRGKPDPAVFLEAARRLAVAPAQAAVVEDAIAGIEAGRSGGFGLVIGVARADNRAALLSAGADVVVADPGELLGSRPDSDGIALPEATERLPEIRKRLSGKRAAVFLDYDGTLTPIVARPDLAVLSEDMRQTLRDLARRCTLAIVSGRDRADVTQLVGLQGLVYAGSHGFDIAGPDGLRREHDGAAAFLPSLDEAESLLADALGGIPGALVDRKKFALAVHYRQVAEDAVAEVKRIVEAVADQIPDLRQTGGKMILELRPRTAWDKGRAVLWLMEELGLDGTDVLPFYLGDDDTDEDAFEALAGRGIGILVTEAARPTAADYVLSDPDEVRRFLAALAAMLPEDP